MADSDDVPPPLEDMTELLQQVDKLREYKAERVPQVSEKDTTTKQNGHSAASQKESTPASVRQINKVPETVSNAGVKKSEAGTTTFGGMKKGFLFGSSPSTKSTTKKVPPHKEEEIPYIKPKDPESRKKQYQMPEVQEAMKASQSFLENKDWVTEDLLEQVQKNPVLSRHLADPKFSQALHEFQTNPEGAMTKYSDSPEVQLFFKEFCGLLGDHFSKLGESRPSSGSGTSGAGDVKVSHASGADIKLHNPAAPSPDDERRMQEILAKPDVREILTDPQIQKLFSDLRANPEDAQRLLQTKDKELHRKISRLVDVGLLQFQS